MSLAAPTSPPTQHPEPEEPRAPALFRHKKRKEWGLAILAWDRGVKRAFLFEDGELRVIARGFFGMIEEIDRPADEARALIRKLSAHLDAHAARALLGSDSASAMTFDDQIGVFRALYPGGFAGDEWQKGVRGKGQKRPLKRHRDAAIARAQELLAKDVMDKKLLAGDASSVVADIISVLDGTDLVSKAQIRPLTKVAPARHEELARATHDLLWGPDEEVPRMASFISTLESLMGTTPSWQLVTALPALVHPKQDVPVRPSRFRDQAKYMAPRVTLANTPDANVYSRVLGMATMIRDRLQDAGLEPQDLVDVHDFVCLTLSPKAQKQWDDAKSSLAAADAEAA
ncbi:MAG: hypothetical protein H6717_29525 [Polyangiaceae bacterium]|nr:hypothetical protein [Polyangiaceae bacterium]